MNPPWICHEVIFFSSLANYNPFFIFSLLQAPHFQLSLTSIYSMSRYHETNPHFLPHRQSPQPRAHPFPSQQHPEPQADPSHSRQQPRAQPFPSQQHPEPQADPSHSRQQPRAQPFPSQHQPEPQAGADPSHSRQHPERRGRQPVTSPQYPSQQPSERRVQFTSPEHPSQQRPERRDHPDTSSQQQSRSQTRPSRQHPGSGLWVPAPQKTKPLTWFAAVFCVIFWVIVIVGGLIVLIVYMLFRPRSPRFDVSSVSLNAAYLDMGYLLNADVTVLANFTNPNRKVHVDFSYLVINLYYEDTLIASRAINPFSAASMQTMFADVHMVTSQVRLPIKDSQKFAEQIQNNGIEFQLKGYFRTRSNLGSFLRYSYWLYGKCSIVVTAPPSGVLVSRSCRTKR